MKREVPIKFNTSLEVKEEITSLLKKILQKRKEGYYGNKSDLLSKIVLEELRRMDRTTPTITNTKKPKSIKEQRELVVKETIENLRETPIIFDSVLKKFFTKAFGKDDRTQEGWLKVLLDENEIYIVRLYFSIEKKFDFIISDRNVWFSILANFCKKLDLNIMIEVRQKTSKKERIKKYLDEHLFRENCIKLSNFEFLLTKYIGNMFGIAKVDPSELREIEVIKNLLELGKYEEADEEINKINNPDIETTYINGKTGNDPRIDVFKFEAEANG